MGVILGQSNMSEGYIGCIVSSEGYAQQLSGVEVIFGGNF